MIVIRSQVYVGGMRGRDVYDFLLSPTDREYQRWWPGTHLALHTLVFGPNDIGNEVFMDEFIGRRRVKLRCVVVAVEQGKRIVWQMKKLVRLPVRLSVEFRDDAEGVAITHTIRAGFDGFGRILDPVLRTYFSREFQRTMDAHVRTEFRKLRDLFHERACPDRSRPCAA